MRYLVKLCIYMYIWNVFSCSLIIVKENTSMSPKTQNKKQARSQELGLGGLFWILKKASNDLDPDFNRGLIRWSWFFRPKLRDLRKKNERKIFTEIKTVFPAKIRWSPEKKMPSPKFSHFLVQKHTSSFLVQITGTFSQLLIANLFGGGLFSFLEQKSASKALKTWYFAYFSGQ